MRWLAGWSGGLSQARLPAARRPLDQTVQEALTALATVRPIAATALWTGPDPLWAVGDWRPEEVRQFVHRPGDRTPQQVTGTADLGADTEATARLLVLGHCGAGDQELAAGLAAARGGAVRHLTGWAAATSPCCAWAPAPPCWSPTWPACNPSSTRPGAAAPPTPPPGCRSPTWSAPAWTPATWPPRSPAPNPPRRSAPAAPTPACTGSRPATPWRSAAAARR